LISIKSSPRLDSFLLLLFLMLILVLKDVL